jgi:ribonuclease HI
VGYHILYYYIDDIVVKSAEFSSHIADLRKAFDKMRRYGLKMNPRKCAFGVSDGKSLGFIIHEHGIEIDPDRIKSIRNVGPLTCKLEVQKFLDKVNYLQRFISNLAGKIDAFTPILRLKNDVEFTWGAEQHEAFDLIRKYLSSAPMLKAPQVGVPFRLYIAAEDKVIGVVLTQETEGKEHVVTYLSRRLVYAKTRYTFIEKLCLCLFYACTKCRCYLMSSHCTVSGQTDVIKYMLQNPIMSGRIVNWAYALKEYDLAYKPLKSMKGQVIADFIVEHRIDDTHKLEISYLTVTPWILYFDGSVCNEGQRIGIMLISPSNVSFDFSNRLKTYCTNNQAKYEALLFGLEMLSCMGVKHVRAFGDSQLVVQQVLEEYQCFNGTLNSYLEKCWGIIHSFDEFSIRHISRVENHRANNLAQDTSG